jgi:tight adherence protein C
MATQLTLWIALSIAGVVLLVMAALRSSRDQTNLTALVGTTRQAADPNQVKSRPSLGERLFRPTLRRLTNLGRTLTPASSIARLQKDLVTAGQPGGLSVTDFLGLRFLAGASIAAVLFTMVIVRDSAAMAILLAALGFIIGLSMPNVWLKGRMQTRQRAMARALPDTLDMMSICVDAGLGFEAAIQKVAYQANHELAVELRRVIGEIRVGISRADALRNLAERCQVPEVASFVAVLVQADKLGVAIRNVLATQSVQMRIQRRQRAEEEAGKAPIKMLIPLVLFIFPALFAVLLGPAIPRIMAIF